MRRYESKLREEQVERTRELILRAFVDELGAGSEDFSVQRVAARAGVGVRTVYHHFPTREAQIEAVAGWLEAEMLGDEAGPRDLGDLPEYAERVYRRALEHEAATRASLAPGVAALVRTVRRRKRLAQIDRVLEGLHLPGPEARRLAAVVKAVVSAEFGFALMDRYGLSGEEAILAVRQVITALVGKRPRRGP